MGIKIPLDRIALLFGVAGTMLKVGRREGPFQWRARLAISVNVALLVLVIASAIWWSTLFQPLPFYSMLDRALIPFVLFISSGFYASPYRQMLFVRVLVCLGIYLGATSILSLTPAAGLVWPTYIMNPSIGIHFGRARGPFVESAANGVALLFCYASALFLFSFEPRWRWKLLCTVSSVLCLVGALLTYTRSIWIAGVVVSLLFVALRPRARLIVASVFGIGGAITAVALIAIPEIQSAIFDRSGATTPIDDRTNTNATAVRLIQEYPLTGIGWGRFLQTVDDNTRQLPNVPITNVHIEAHNVFLSRAAELGLPGGILWLLVFVFTQLSAANVGLKFRETAAEGVGVLMAAVAACYFIVAMSTPMPYPFANYVSFALAGVILRPITRE